MVSDIPTGDGNVANLFYGVYAADILCTMHIFMDVSKKGKNSMPVVYPPKKAKQILPLRSSQLENIECSNRRVEEGDRLYTVQTVPWLYTVQTVPWIYTVQCTARNWLLAILLPLGHRSTILRRTFRLISGRNKKIGGEDKNSFRCGLLRI